jgi:NADH-quinone oxidoreductase subunit M
LIEDYGGIAKVVPVFATFFMIATLSSIGLPGTNGFVGEFLILLGAFSSKTVYAVLGAIGIILAAVYMLWMIQRVLFQEIKNEENKKLIDLNLREKLILIPIVLIIFWIGFYPQAFLSKIEPSVKNMLEYVNDKTNLSTSVERGCIKECEMIEGAGPVQGCK